MKNFLTLFIVVALIGIGNIVFCQPWQERVSGVTVQLTSVSAIDNNNAWVCGYSGTVLRTTNQGINWLNVSGNGIPATIQLINVWGINAATALVSGYIGTNTWVYYTSNSGANWAQVFTQTGGFINALEIKLDGTGFMAGDPVGGRWSLWKTTNNGLNWDSTGLYLAQAGAETGYNNCLSYALNRIWFGTNNSRIYHSTNNGSSWSVQTVTPETDITSIWFDINGSSTGYCGGNNVLKTTNYGANWVSIGSMGTGLIVGIAGLQMWGGNLWYVRSGSNIIYFGYGNGQWMVSYTAPAGTYRHVTTDRIPSFPFIGYAVRTNGGINFTFVIVEGIHNLGGEIPVEFLLFQNYPNPFNPNTNIKFQIAKPGFTKLILFDVLGREIQTLLNQHLLPGTYKVDFNGEALTSGIYFYKLESSEYSRTMKMILIK